MRPLFNAWRDVAVVHGAGGLADAVAGGAISRSAGMAIEGTDLPSQPKPLPKGSPPPPAGRDQVPFKAAPIVAKNAPPKAGRDQVPRPKPPPPILLAPLPPKMPSPPRALMIKPPPPIRRLPMEVQIRRTNSLPTMKSPPMAPSQDTRYRFDDEPPLAATIPENLREDEPSTSTFTSTSTSTSSTREPVRLPSRSHSWPVRRKWFTVWPYNLIFYRRSNSDSCLWMHWWIEEVD